MKTEIWCVVERGKKGSSCTLNSHHISLSQLYSLQLPYHWLKDFFLAAASLNLLLVEDALSYYTNLSLVGFGSSCYITAQLALVNYHRKGDWSVCLVINNSVALQHEYM